MDTRKKMFKFFLIVLTVVILCVVNSGILSYAEPAAKPIKLLWATFTPPRDYSTEAMQAFAEDLKKSSGGKVEIELSLGGALAPAPQLYDKLVAGACDMIFFQPYLVTGVFPYAEVTALPCMLPNGVAGAKAILSLFKKGYVDKAWDKVKLIWPHIGGGAVIFWHDKPVTTIADFANKKIRTFSPPLTEAMSALGAVPVTMSVMEVYGALEKGTIHGMWGGYMAVIPFKFHEVVKYVTEMDMSAGLLCAAMNLNSYKKLPKDIQKIIDEMSYPNEKYTIEAAKRAEAEEIIGRKKIEEAGRIDKLAPEELSKMDPLLAPIWTKWIADKEAKGLKPKEMLAEFYSLLKAAGVEKPFVGYTPGN
ncbi:MAG: TRAP transporter substrate-binding protein DctP [Deltaproteobacteria bacterium]|nr:TRAP transporter substrate-binding protein DctP [Deltaproteobacteria bacterium]